MKRLFIALFVLLLHSVTLAEQAIVPVDQAFRFSANLVNGNQLQLNWQIAPGYQLYQSSIDIQVVEPTDTLLVPPQLPPGTTKFGPRLDEHNNLTESEYIAYTDELALNLAISYSNDDPLTILVHYQGCADSGFCYPPITKQLDFPAGITDSAAIITDQGLTYTAPITTEITNTSIAITSDATFATRLLQDRNWVLILGAFLLLGLLLSFTPCVLPMYPILSGIIIGQRKNINTHKAFLLSLTYVLAMASTYAIAGALAGWLGFSVQAFLQKPWVLITSSIVFVLLSLSLFGFYELRLPNGLAQHIHRLNHKQKGGSYLGVASMGVLATLVVSPCITAPLVGTLTYISQTGDMVLGSIALFTMGIGMGIPLIIMGTSEGKLLPNAGPWMLTIKNFFGVILLAIAIWLIERVIPGEITLLLWSALLMISAMYMGAFSTNLPIGWPRFWQGVSWLMIVYAVLLIIGASLGNTNPLKPLGQSVTAPSIVDTHANRAASFIPIKSVTDVEAAIAQAQTNNQAVLLKYNADWCVTCKLIDKYVFDNADVQTKLENVVLLVADVTANDAIDREVQQHYGVFAPPALIFFDTQGNEIPDSKIVGDISANKFIAHLKQHGIIE